MSSPHVWHSYSKQYPEQRESLADTSTLQNADIFWSNFVPKIINMLFNDHYPIPGIMTQKYGLIWKITDKYTNMGGVFHEQRIDARPVSWWNLRSFRPIKVEQNGGKRTNPATVGPKKTKEHWQMIQSSRGTFGNIWPMASHCTSIWEGDSGCPTFNYLVSRDSSIFQSSPVSGAFEGIVIQ